MGYFGLEEMLSMTSWLIGKLAWPISFFATSVTVTHMILKDREARRFHDAQKALNQVADADHVQESSATLHD